MSEHDWVEIPDHMIRAVAQGPRCTSTLNIGGVGDDRKPPRRCSLVEHHESRHRNGDLYWDRNGDLYWDRNGDQQAHR